MRKLRSIPSTFLLALITGPVAIPLLGQPVIEQQHQFDEVLLDMDFRDSDRGALLSSESVWITDDGGESWKRTLPLVFRPPFSAFALRGDSGFVIGDERGNVHSTKSPASDWVTFEVAPDNPVREIVMIEDESWILRTDSEIFWTVDGGASYATVVPSVQTNLTDVDVLSDSIWHFTGYAQTAFRTVDAGKTWVKMPVPQGHVYGVRFVSRDTGFLAVWYPWYLFKTVDGGATWEEAGPFEYPTRVDVLSGGRGIYTTRTYARVSSDGGESWSDEIYFPGQEPETFPLAWDGSFVKVLSDGQAHLLLVNQTDRRSLFGTIRSTSGVYLGRPRFPLDLSLRH